MNVLIGILVPLLRRFALPVILRRLAAAMSRLGAGRAGPPSASPDAGRGAAERREQSPSTPTQNERS